MKERKKYIKNKINSHDSPQVISNKILRVVDHTVCLHL
jgi:hypothetical protein